jgi:lysine/ornithine N-monooxygenase
VNKKQPNINILYNNKTFLDIVKRHSYFDSDYYKFFLGLNKEANKSLLSEKELLTYKLTLNKKFSDIVLKYDN